MKTLKLKLAFMAMVYSFFLVSCKSTKTALYDPYSYQRITELRVETATLMDKATLPYSGFASQADKLLLETAKMTEYEKNKPNNEIIYAMWKIFSDKEKNFLAGFFKRWEEKGKFSTVFLGESKKQVLEAMDLLIQYESKKDKVSEDGLLNLINLNK
jgi:hypothetical protein